MISPCKTGEATFFELSGCYRRYHAPLSRSIYLGKPPSFMLDAAAAVTEGLENGLAMAKPGNTTADIANAMNAVMVKTWYRPWWCPLWLPYWFVLPTRLGRAHL
jgi:ectoine hydrolase